MPHTVSAILGLITALLVAVALGVLYGFIPSASVNGLEAGGLGWLAGVAFVAAAGAYLIEESSYRPKRSMGSFAGTVAAGRRRRR